MKKTKLYIEEAWEKVEGMQFEQPVDYCNGIKLDYETIKNFNKIFGASFGNVKRESDSYNDAIKASKYYSDLWLNEKARDTAFEKIYNFNLSGKSGQSSSVTPLFPFEIYMMNDGFEMISFCELNAINPCVAIIEKEGDSYLLYKRCYAKKNYFVYLGFGVDINEIRTNFYFVTNKSKYIFQVDNNIDNYKNAIDGKLKPLELVYN